MNTPRLKRKWDIFKITPFKLWLIIVTFLPITHQLSCLLAIKPISNQIYHLSNYKTSLQAFQYYLWLSGSLSYIQSFPNKSWTSFLPFSIINLILFFSCENRNFSSQSVCVSEVLFKNRVNHVNLVHHVNHVYLVNWVIRATMGLVALFLGPGTVGHPVNYSMKKKLEDDLWCRQCSAVQCEHFYFYLIFMHSCHKPKLKTKYQIFARRIINWTC